MCDESKLDIRCLTETLCALLQYSTPAKDSQIKIIDFGTY